MHSQSNSLSSLSSVTSTAASDSIVASDSASILHDMIDPLTKSLLAIVKHPFSSTSPDFRGMLPDSDTRHTLRFQSMADGAEYFIFRDNSLLTMVFPALIDQYGSYSHNGPYFNLSDGVSDIYNIVTIFD